MNGVRPPAGAAGGSALIRTRGFRVGPARNAVPAAARNDVETRFLGVQGREGGALLSSLDLSTSAVIAAVLCTERSRRRLTPEWRVWQPQKTGYRGCNDRSTQGSAHRAWYLVAVAFSDTSLKPSHSRVVAADH